MAKSNGHRPGGGIASKVNKQVGIRTAQPRKSVNPTWTMQLGTMQGSHTTGDGESLRERALIKPMYDGPALSVKAGNQWAIDHGQGCGAGATVYKTGS